MVRTDPPILDERRAQVLRKAGGGEVACDRHSAAGSVSQRACVFCGSRVVLYPIVDALHLVHGPIGCAVYTWDIRGSLSSGPELHRNSFSTDLRENEVIHGGEKKLRAALDELIPKHNPKAAFIYATCIAGLIGDDIEAVCRKASERHGIPVIPVMAEGFKGTKKDGYKAACDAMFQLVGAGDTSGISPVSINILGEFNLAGETWMIREYYRKIGIEVVATITGDGRVDDIRRSHGAALNVVQCSGSMMGLAKRMKDEYGIPFKRVSYFGFEDTAAALYDVAEALGGGELTRNVEALVRAETAAVLPEIRRLAKDLKGRKAAIYVGGAFKAFSLVRALRMVGMQTAVVGSQTGGAEDYRQLEALCDDGTIIVDDSNPVELSHFVKETGVDLFIGGVKERPIAYKLGIGFCDHNHERKIALSGFEGMLNFVREVHRTVTSPVWQFVPRSAARFTEAAA